MAKGKGSGITLGFLKFVLGLDGLAFEEGLNLSAKQLKAAERKIAATGQKIAGVGTSLSIGITAPFAALVASAIPAATESAQALAQVEAAQKSMGGASKLSTAELQSLAGELQHISNFDDDDILKSVTANLLTFGNVSGATFKEAQLAAVNLSARLGQDLQSSAIQVGKALNDPVKGVKALSRVGVQFTEQQKDQIAAMVEAGNTAGAQAIILKELASEFGGAAKAQRDATPNAAQAEQWRTFQEVVGGIVNKVLPPLTAFLTRVLEGFNNLSPAMQTTVVAGAAIAAALGPVLVIAGSLVTTLAPVIAALGAAGLGGALAALGPVILPVVAGAAALAGAWALFGDKIAPVLAGLWQQAQAVLGPKLIALFDQVSGAVTALWSGPLGDGIKGVIAIFGDFEAGYAKAFGGALIAVLGVALDVVTATLRGIGDAIKFVVALLTGDWGGAWTAAKDFAATGVKLVLGILDTLAPGASAAIGRIVTEIGRWLGKRLNAIWDGVKVKIDQVKGWFFGLYDAVVGHSYIPEMVDEIGAHTARLAKLFVKPSKDMIEEVRRGYEKGARDIAEIFAKMESAPGLVKDRPTADEQVDQTAIFDEVTAWGLSLPDVLGEPAKKTTAGVIQNFADMARGVIGSIRNISDAIKHGDFLDVIQSVLDAVIGLGQAGVFGSAFKAQTSPASFGGFRAGGGPTVPGRSYIVGENGPEWFTPGARGFVTPGNDNGGRSRVEIVPSAYFDVVVDGRASNVAAPMVAQGSVAASRGAQIAVAKRQDRRLA